MVVNFVVRFVPTVVTATMITTAINPAMRPYSMAVTPDSSRTKRERRAFMMPDPQLVADGNSATGPWSALLGPSVAQRAWRIQSILHLRRNNRPRNLVDRKSVV